MRHILPNASILAGRTLGAGKPFEFIKAEVKIGVNFVYEEGESGKEIEEVDGSKFVNRSLLKPTRLPKRYWNNLLGLNSPGGLRGKG